LVVPDVSPRVLKSHINVVTSIGLLRAAVSTTTGGTGGARAARVECLVVGKCLDSSGARCIHPTVLWRVAGIAGSSVYRAAVDHAASLYHPALLVPRGPLLVIDHRRNDEKDYADQKALRE